MNCYDKCVNRGRPYGPSQESYCEHCSRPDSWKQDLYKVGCNMFKKRECTNTSNSAFTDLLVSGRKLRELTGEELLLVYQDTSVTIVVYQSIQEEVLRRIR